MKFLTAEQILFIHARLIDETGGSHGVRDLSMLLSAAGRPQATYGSQDLYPDFFHKAGALMDSLIRNHPFLDGNKRTGIAAAVLFSMGINLIVQKMSWFPLPFGSQNLNLAWMKSPPGLRLMPLNLNRPGNHLKLYYPLWEYDNRI